MQRQLRALHPATGGESVTSVLPSGDRPPVDGLLPVPAEGPVSRVFGMYLHVPFCRVRCGYCDFNTYTAGTLRGVRQEDFAEQAIAEITFARRVLEASGVPDRPIETVFFGGGTPTLLPVTDLVRMLAAARAEFGLRPDAEVTIEANPDTVGPRELDMLAAGGITRISFGMQSAVPHVLATLDRTHDPKRVAPVVTAAHSAGLAVSVDLIFGTPGESLADWQRSLDAALACRPEHITTYSPILQEGTALARRIRRGELAAPTDDMQADMYELADQRFAAAGFEWYEISNWAQDASHRSRHNLGYWRGGGWWGNGPGAPPPRPRHNLGYWRGDDWWGIGPGAHSHIGGVRWWNVKHPAAYAERITAGVSPAAGRERLDSQTREVERVMLGVRVRAGIALASLSHSARLLVAEFIAEELIDAQAALAGELTLTRRGRLLADAVVRRLLEASDADS